MLNKIQNKLLISKPLLWNMKIVPTSLILLLINLIFLIVGYASGGLDFNEDNSAYNYLNNSTTIFFSILVGIIVVILWLVSYFKNNAFKTFYPKGKFDLFKEWSSILLVCFLTCFFMASYFYGVDARRRSYFSEKELIKRCDILSQGSYFVEGSYSNNYSPNVDTVEAVEAAATAVDTAVSKTDSLNYIKYRGKKYKYFSLLNKNLNSYTCFNHSEDSLREVKIKDWLVAHQTDSLKNIFKNYLAISKEHQLKASIDENQWFKCIDDFPLYENTKTIGKQAIDDTYYEGNDYQAQNIDTTSKYFRRVNKERKLFYKYYVPENKLNFNYGKIADAYNNPTVNSDFLLVTLYFAIGFSLLIFSFRVTSGRNWLIAIVSIGILNILFGIFSMILPTSYTYPVLLLLLYLFLFFYFIKIIIAKKTKQISGITINGMLWILPAFVPLCYFLFIEIYKDVSGYRSYNDWQYINEKFPLIKTLEDNFELMMYLNIIFIVLMMFFYTIKIRKWKGIAES